MKRLFALAVLAAAVTSPLVAQAAPREMVVLTGDGPDHARRQVPLQRVLGMLASRYPGRHLNSTMGDAGGRPAYYVQWQMEDGRVVVFVVDAGSGQVIGRQGG